MSVVAVLGFLQKRAPCGLERRLEQPDVGELVVRVRAVLEPRVHVAVLVPREGKRRFAQGDLLRWRRDAPRDLFLICNFERGVF